MFKLKKENVVWWPVTISEPTDNGEVIEHKCHMLFELVTQNQFDELADKGDRELLAVLVKGWKEILDVDEHPLTFSKEHLDALLQLPYVRASILRAYMQAMSGAPAKN